jgi:hypothetical protein
MCFRFSARSFVKQLNCSVFEAAKTLGTIEDSGLPCTPTPHIVKQAWRAIALLAWQSIYFGAGFIGMSGAMRGRRN